MKAGPSSTKANSIAPRWDLMSFSASISACNAPMPVSKGARRPSNAPTSMREINHESQSMPEDDMVGRQGFTKVHPTTGRLSR